MGLLGHDVSKHVHFAVPAQSLFIVHAAEGRLLVLVVRGEAVVMDQGTESRRSVARSRRVGPSTEHGSNPGALYHSSENLGS